jgi:N-acetylated-alpha-linked acidic dipeptidase
MMVSPRILKIPKLTQYIGKYEYKPIYDVIGTVKGKGEELIVLGNHHDSWCCGAVDPVSGSAAMNEVVRGLGNLTLLGWQPERTMYVSFLHCYYKSLIIPAFWHLGTVKNMVS